MKIRIKFSKQGCLKFVGHLDLMRYFQKAIRRAEIDIKYSEGFSPHQVMSFAAPLGVGLTSNGEYMDIELNSSIDPEQLKDKLNQVMVEGIRICSCHQLSNQAVNAMSLVAAADYTVSYRESYQPVDLYSVLKRFCDFYNQEEIRIMKKTKKSEKELNIKPLIYEANIEGETIFLKLATGSANNIKPELVMKAFYECLGETYADIIFEVQREEVYANLGDETTLHLVPLAHVGGTGE